ncbi:MAG: hypothetical protein ACRDKG_06030 [Actinomycetota bacterium]
MRLRASLVGVALLGVLFGTTSSSAVGVGFMASAVFEDVGPFDLEYRVRVEPDPVLFGRASLEIWTPADPAAPICTGAVAVGVMQLDPGFVTRIPPGDSQFRISVFMDGAMLDTVISCQAPSGPVFVVPLLIFWQVPVNVPGIHTGDPLLGITSPHGVAQAFGGPLAGETAEVAFLGLGVTGL